ncbi:MAG: helix-turn-helix transcriptional regulator [Spirochaetales bacterium]|nr:helix-turn-helix transcriptional regulator [Spirochaetales bacterium]MBR4426847.1 helix-turn-helix transcriptional regulator [Spirochaetales bacterium]
MIKVLVAIISILIGIAGILFGKSESDKRKAAEDRAKKAEQEVKDIATKAEISEAAHVEHVNQIGETIATPDSELTETANELFAAELTVGEKLKKARTDQRMSLLDASKKTGYTARRIAGIESDDQITSDDIKILGKAYGLERSQVSELRKQLGESSSAKEDDR